MAQKHVGRKQYYTAKGKPFDMDQFRQEHELTPAVGNMRVNARGDEIKSSRGEIETPRSAKLSSYYTQLQDEQITKKQPNIQVASEDNLKTTKKRKNIPKDDQWVEDADGNFVPKDA